MSNPLTLSRTACTICAQATLFSDKPVSKNNKFYAYIEDGCGFPEGLRGRLTQQFVRFILSNKTAPANRKKKYFIQTVLPRILEIGGIFL
jgi:hypothetical protein